MRVVEREARAPARGVADVSADVREQRRAVESIAVALGAGEPVAAAGFRAELEEGVGGREPLHLHTVLRELAAEERLIDERLIDEVPRVRVNFVEIAEAGEEPAALDREAVVERERAEVGFFDRDLV